MDYRKAGVDLKAAADVVERIRPLAAATSRRGCIGAFGAFGSMFDIGVLGMKNPVLVSGTDGVGTKLLLALALDRLDTVGIDAVAMVVNDILCHGATPLFLLDYIASGSLDPSAVERIVAGIAQGCRLAGCALSGGETAEMPGLYRSPEFDLAAFAVGAVEKERIIDGSKVAEGDIIVALPSSGLHSNGFSLVRRIIADCNLDMDAVYPETASPLPLGDLLLEPAAIYVKPVLKLLERIEVHGIAHITGGGLQENTARIVPPGLKAEINFSSWEVPPLFGFLQKMGNVERQEMFRVFNMGVGMVLVVAPDDVSPTIDALREEGIESWQLGHIKV